MDLGRDDYGRHEDTRMSNPLGFGSSMEDNVERIKERYPEASRTVIREELKRNRGDVSATMTTLKALVQVAKLRKEFPKLSPDVVAHVLKKHKGDRDEAAAELAQLVLDYHKMKLKKKRETLKREQSSSYGGGYDAPAPRAAPANNRPTAAPTRSFDAPTPSGLPPPPGGFDDEEPPPVPGQGGGGATCRALYDYQTGQPAKLDFAKGDLIKLSDASGDAWWYGSIRGDKGKFPKTYVRHAREEIEAIALYDFGEKDGHLKFKRDDVIILLNKRKGSQWWEGVLSHGGPVGIFPINYVNVSQNVDLYQQLQNAD